MTFILRHTITMAAIALPAATAAAAPQHMDPAEAPATAQDAHAEHGQHEAQGQTELPPTQDAHSGHVPRETTALPPVDHGDDHHAAAMTGAYGPYPASREASGTAWQPDAGRHGGLHVKAGDWTLMGHLLLNAVHDWQQGPRGAEETFVSGMAMGAARRDFANGSVVQLRAMASPDPLMGRSGYPLLLAAGETADGVTPLIDRQHPHDFLMELSASYSLPIDEHASLFVYGGLPGEPAFGPPAFMHRQSILDSPEAPITHHWLDSTHITFGVVTAGVTIGNVKLEASRFNGREPDQERWDIETGPLDSTAARISWNPGDHLSLQASWARLIEPEQLAPGENSTRWSASAIYTRPIGAEGWFSSSLAWGRRSAEHDELDAFLIETAAGWREWTLFGRAEQIETNELVQEDGHHGPTFDVAKASIGVLRDFRVAPQVRIGIGGLYSTNFVPATLEALYAGDPDGAMLFVRLKVE